MIRLIAALVLVMMTAAPAFAKSTVWCKDADGRPFDAMSDMGWECGQALAFGEACFTGKRGEVIEIINRGEFDNDEEWLENAKYKGRDQISYEWVDGPNEVRHKYSMLRCTDEFFGN